MTRLRALVVGATIVGTLGGSLSALALDRLLWPFAHYPMFSNRFGPTVDTAVAVGVTADGRELALPISVEPSGTSLDFIVRRAERRSDAPERLVRIATAMAKEYERQRAAGGVDGPPLAAVRLYHQTVDLASRPPRESLERVAEGPTP